MAGERANFEETRGVMDDIVQLLDSATEAEAVARVEAETVKAEAGVEAVRMKAQDIIKGMTKEVEASRKRATRDAEAAGEHDRRLGSLAAERDTLAQTVEGLKAACSELRKNTEEEAARAQAMEAKIASAVEVDSMRETKYALSLYVNISHVKFDYDSPHVKGYITDPVTKAVRRFDFDPKAQSKFFMANALWDTMSG